jgi:NifB/MoaA-like Fe-S oxidoreductase
MMKLHARGTEHCSSHACIDCVRVVNAINTSKQHATVCEDNVSISPGNIQVSNLILMKYIVCYVELRNVRIQVVATSAIV